MGKLTEGKQPEPTTPKIATQFDGEQPNTEVKAEGKRKFDYAPKPQRQEGDSGKG